MPQLHPDSILFLADCYKRTRVYRSAPSFVPLTPWERMNVERWADTPLAVDGVDDSGWPLRDAPEGTV